MARYPDYSPVLVARGTGFPGSHLCDRLFKAEGVDAIYNLACAASPVHYQFDPVQTTRLLGNSEPAG